MPQAIRLTDAERHSANYVPFTVRGKVVDSLRFHIARKPAAPSIKAPQHSSAGPSRLLKNVS
jgi:hypothetical protein